MPEIAEIYINRLSDTISKYILHFYVGILYPSGEPISLHLLRYETLAVEDHSCVSHALHLQQPRLVNNPGK